MKRIKIGSGRVCNLAICIFICLTHAPYMHAQITDAEKITDPLLSYGTLSNGMTYYLRPTKAIPGQIYAELVVKAGELYVPSGKMNLAHHTEHMGFRTLDNFPDVKAEAVGLGLSMGGGFNASTTHLSTNYHFQIPGDDPQKLETVLRILRAQASTISAVEQQVEEEKNAVISEASLADVDFEMRNEAEGLLSGQYTLFNLDSIIAQSRRITKGDVEKFRRDWYHPSREAILIVGDFDTAAMRKKIVAIFSDLTDPVSITPQPDLDGIHNVHLNGTNKVFTVSRDVVNELKVELVKKRKTVYEGSLSIDEQIKQKLMNELFSVMLGERAKSQLRRYHLPYKAVSYYLQNTDFNERSGIGTLRTSVFVNKVEEIDAALNAAIRDVEQIRRYGFTKQEFAAAVEKVLTPPPPVPGNLQMTALPYRTHFVYGTAVISPELRSEKNKKILQQLSVNDINTMAAQWMDMERDFDIVYKIPNQAKSILPPATALLSEIKKVKKKTIPAPQIISLPTALMDERTKMALNGKAVYSSESPDQIGATELHLENKIRFILKPSISRTSKMEIAGIGPLIKIPSTTEERLIADHAGQIIRNSGVAAFDKFELDGFLQDRNIDLSFGVSDGKKRINGSAGELEQEALLQGIFLFLTHPRKDADAFADWKNKWKEQQQSGGKDVSKVFWDSVKVLSGYYSLGTSGDVDRISLQEVYSLYQREFVQSPDFTFIVTGNFNKEKLIPLLVKYFGSLTVDRSLPGSAKASPVRNVDRSTDTSFQFLMKAGEERTAQVELRFPFYAKNDLVNNIKMEMIAKVLELKMYDRLRTKEGLVYGVGCSVMGRPERQNEKELYKFSIGASCRAELTNKLIAAAVDEFNKLRTEGIDQAMFDNVSKILLSRQGFRFNTSLPHFWTRHLPSAIELGMDPSEILKAKTIIQDVLTVDDLNAAIKEFVTAERIQQMVWVPENAPAVQFYQKNK